MPQLKGKSRTNEEKSIGEAGPSGGQRSIAVESEEQLSSLVTTIARNQAAEDRILSYRSAEMTDGGSTHIQATLLPFTTPQSDSFAKCTGHFDGAVIDNGGKKCGVHSRDILFEQTQSQYYPDILNIKEFCSLFPTNNKDLNTALFIYLQIIKENVMKEQFKIIEYNLIHEISMKHNVKDIANRIGVTIEFGSKNILNKQNKTTNVGNNDKTCDVVLVYDLLQDKQKAIEIQNCLHNNSFVLALEKATTVKSMLQNKYFTIISATRISKTNVLFLLKKRYDYEMYGRVAYIKVDNYYKFSWLKQAHMDLCSKKKVILLSVNQRYNGVIGIVKYLSKTYGNRLRLVKINDLNAPIFDPENIFYKEQLQKQLIMNILQKGQWGGFYSLPCKQFAPTGNYIRSFDRPEDFNSLTWCQIPTPNISPVSVQVHYAGISLNDVDEATGTGIINDQKLRMDFSGIDIKIKCSSENSFVVVCDNDELGLEITDLLVKRGAKKIILHLKKGRLSGYGETKLVSWRNQNVQIDLVFDDIETEEGCSNIFNHSIKMGPIEGIFIILDRAKDNCDNIMDANNYKSFNEVASGVINLEATSRDFMLKTLRYFTILSQSPSTIFEEYINSISEDICRARNAVGLPGMMFQFSSASDISNTSTRTLHIPTLCNGLEASLEFKLNNVEIFNMKHTFDELHSIESGVPVKMNEIKDDFSEQNKIVNIEETFENFKSKRQDVMKTKSNFYGGVGAFYSFIDDDFYRATEPFIPMTTKVVNSFMENYELEPNETYLMLVPGFEGHSKIFETLSLRLKIKAFTIQLTPDMTNDSIQEIATDIFKLMKKRLALKEKFYLLGYSFGVNIALELTCMLEKEGHIGIVYFLDSSPDVLRTQIETYIGQQSDTQLQNSIIEHMFRLVKGNNVSNISEDVKTINNWDKKIEYFIKHVKGFSNFSHQYIKILLDSAYKRMILVRNYNPVFNLNSQLILLRGIPHPDSKSLPRDYNLSKYSRKPIKVFEIESDTALAPYDGQVTNIINKTLDPSLLEEFNKSSLMA